LIIADEVWPALSEIHPRSSFPFARLIVTNVPGDRGLESAGAPIVLVAIGAFDG